LLLVSQGALTADGRTCPEAAAEGGWVTLLQACLGEQSVPGVDRGCEFSCSLYWFTHTTLRFFTQAIPLADLAGMDIWTWHATRIICTASRDTHAGAMHCCFTAWNISHVLCDAM
jgi:hypothetical protein